MERQLLTIMNYVDGTNDTPFHDAENPITITEYTYSTTRMGSTQLTATLRYPVCLDDEWDGTQYVEFRGERHFISGTPSSSKDNEDARYSHSLTFRAERDIVLNNVYFYDAVSEESTGDDKYKSNSTKVVFFGDIHEFVARLNESLDYSGVGYTAVVDEGVTSEAKLMSFEDQFFFNVLQEIYNTYGLPFYFVGKVIHIGYTDNAITRTFRYGFDNELLSIKKNNANFRIVNRCTGTGSEDNIPYYYPNKTDKGNPVIAVPDTNTGISASDVSIESPKLFMDSVGRDKYVEYIDAIVGTAEVFNSGYIDYDGSVDPSKYVPFPNGTGSLAETYYIRAHCQNPGRVKVIIKDIDIYSTAKNDGNDSSRLEISGIKFSSPSSYNIDANPKTPYFKVTPIITSSGWSNDGYYRKGDGFYLDIQEAVPLREGIDPPDNIMSIGEFKVYCNVREKTFIASGYTVRTFCKLTVEIEYEQEWSNEGQIVTLSDVGLSIGDAVPAKGDRIINKAYKITESSVLLPPKYRETFGAERFYNAENDTYTNPDTGLKYEFENEYVPSAPKEHIQEFEDIKPTIKDMTNASGQRMDTILAVAFDTGDNDDVDDEGNYLHPYFFVKLPKYDGENGFNLFDHSIDEDEMSLSMTSGQCGACEFTIAVGEETQKNTVQVDSGGNLLRDEDGNVVTSGEPQERQNDTINNEVWIALKKDDNTYGQLMPNVFQSLRPAAGDTFVILHIELPEAYVLAAEQRLEEAIIKYMAENNSEKFNFSIVFSRIFLAENPDIASQLNENSRIQIEYNKRLYQFYISQYTCKCLNDDALPEISVEINDTIAVNKTVIQNTADAILSEVNALIGNSDILMQGMQYFIRKDVVDEVAAKTRFLSGIEFGQFTAGPLGNGGSVSVGSDGSSSMEIDYLTVRRRAEFTQITVEELKGIGGQLIISPAAMKCIRVEEQENSYRCFFDTGDSTTGGIFNSFMINDQVRSQQFNVAGSRFYWRLVTAVGENYIELSKSDCADESDVPMAGDYMVQMGNRTDDARQSAQILSCYGTDSPSFIMYANITSYDLSDKKIAGICTSPETGEPQMFCYGSMFFGDKDIEAEDANYITYQQKAGDTKKRLYISADIKIGAGSSGLSNLEEWSSAQESITDAEQTAQEALDKAQEAKDYIDNTLPSELQEINKRLDGVVENWFYKYTPTRENEPALTWITDGTEADHTGDTFTNIQEYVDDETTPDAGKSWRWALVDGQYTWTPIADSDAVKALQQAARAQDTADQKRRAFVTTPYTPYDVGDIWLQGPNGEIMRCITARASGNYDASDWDKASKYTDDTAANEANERISDIEYLKDIFQKPTVDSEGAILAKLLAVKDENNNVVAGLNASELGSDDEHGKLMLFAGATSIQSVSSSNTRIYEDGSLYTNNLYADGGYFGILSIEKIGDESRLSGVKESMIPGSSTYMTHNNLYIQPQRLIMSASDDRGEAEYFIVDPLGNYDTTYASALLTLRNYGTIKTTQRCLLLLEQNESMRALHIKSGFVAGLRPMTRMITGSTTLTKDDFVIICNNNSFTMTLPRDPENGQMYIIVNPTLNQSANKYVYSPDKNIYSIPRGADAPDRRSTLVKAGTYICVFVGSDNKWWLDYMQNNY